MKFHDDWMVGKLKEKLKSLKGTFKVWNKEAFSNLESKIKMCSDKLQNLDLKVVSSHFSLEDLDNISKVNQEFCNLIWYFESQSFQRSRLAWLTEGDANSRYFHDCVKQRSMRNSLVTLCVREFLLDKVPKV